MVNNRPVIIRYGQNDASVETENYLRNKRWLIGRLNNLQATTRRLYNRVEQDGKTLSNRLTSLQERVNKALEMPYASTVYTE